MDSSNSAAIGQYSFNIVKTINVQDDYTGNTFTEVRHEEPFTVYIVAGDPVNVCPGDGTWHYVDDGSSYDYNDVTTYSSPDDDTSQTWRRIIVDDEEAKIVNIKACVHGDEDCGSNTGCELLQFFRGFEVTWEISGGTQETIQYGDCSS